MIAFLSFLVKQVVSQAAFLATHPKVRKVVRYAAIALVAQALLAGVYMVGRHDEHKVVLIQQAQEAAHAVAEANVARTAALTKFDHGKFRNHPSILPGRVQHGTDGFARD